MIRRRFLALLPLAGIGGVAAARHGASVSAAAEATTARYHVKGFTCITCSAGLETLLGREAGVLAVHATYPEALVTVTFDAATIAEPKIVAAIEEMGFKAERLKNS